MVLGGAGEGEGEEEEEAEHEKKGESMIIYLIKQPDTIGPRALSHTHTTTSQERGVGNE